MAKFAPILPLRQLQDASRKGVAGDYHMLLAHDVAEWDVSSDIDLNFGNMNDVEIILDNSVIELGHPVGRETIQAAVNKCVPTWVVLPDKLEDMYETINMHNHAIYEWGLAPDQQYMAVAQGRSFQEIKDCIDRLIHLHNVTMIGVPRWVTNKLGSRLSIIEHLESIGWTKAGGRIHMLGWSNDILDDMRCSGRPCVYGVDSAQPAVHAFHNSWLDHSTYRHMPRGKWWEEAIECDDVLEYNIRAARSWMG